jgi:5-methylthioadenosine/S-adenosylhomocysteine deaminase
MSTILIQQADVVTLDAQSQILYESDVLIQDGLIAAIGQGLTQPADEVIQAKGSVLMPGFFNAHCHSPMTFERGWAEDLPFPRWLNEKIWVAESALTPDDVYWGAMLAACEMIRTGTVGFNDHYFFMDRVAEVVKQSGLRATLTNCVFGVGADKEVGDGLEEALDFSVTHHNTLNGRLRTCLGPHSPYICPPEFLKMIVEHAQRLGQAIHIHLSESWEQVENSKARYVKTPTEELLDLGVFEGHAVVAHALALTPHDIEILAQKGVYVARTPITYMKMAMPTNRTQELRSAGVRLALGSDGPGSNNDMDMFAILRLETMWEKYKATDPELMAGDLPLRMATQGGAAALGFSNSGRIEVGAAADVILVDFNRAALRPRHSLVANLVFSAKGGDVTHTIVDGQVLLREGQLTTLNEAEIIQQAEQHAFRMVGTDMTLMRRYDA